MRWIVVALILCCAAPVTASAQGFTAELRAGAAVGEVTAALSGPQYHAGPAVFGSVAYAPVSVVAGFLEYGQGQFGCREGFCHGNDVRFTSRGAQAGVQLSADAVWVRAGVVRRTLRSSWATREGRQQDGGSAAGTGIEAGVGVVLELPGAPLPGIVIAPGIRYARHGGAVAAEREGNVGIITVDVGIRWRVSRRP